ncbi:MAG: NAD(P)-binding protein [Firmicutes bacterium]|nr:NAD(P)-binding protein [Bacillota bacterium]
MQVAIMGAGLSGLTCALILEKNGITPAIFEKRSQAGDRFVNGEILLSILTSPIKDTIAYLSGIYGLNFQPISNIRRLILNSVNQRAVIQGHLGFINTRGRDAGSFENQLVRQVKGKITFNSQYTYEQLSKEFSHVVLAVGDAAYTAKIQDFQPDMTVALNGVEVEGGFDRHTVRAWLDQRFAPRGYGYLIPLSDTKANLVLSYPDTSKTAQRREELWGQFWERAREDLGRDLRITKHFEVNRYQIGLCRYPRIGNTFFIGNCFGAIDPYLFFGQFNAILTGIYAALDICGKGRKYQDSCRTLIKNHYYSLVLRRAWEQFDNRKFDQLVKFFGTSLGNWIFSSSLNFIKLASFLARPWIKPVPSG